MQMKKLYQRQDSKTRGRHLVSTDVIEKGDLIFCERPLLSLQSIGNAHTGALVCRNCRCFVGGPHLSLGLAAGTVSREELSNTLSAENDATNPISSAKNDNNSSCSSKNDHDQKMIEMKRITPCRYGCGEIYCSPECEYEMIHFHGHDLLCTGLIEEDGDNDSSTTNNDTADEHESKPLHPLLQFKVHAIQSNEIFLMIADFIVDVISSRRRQLLINSNISKHNSLSNEKDHQKVYDNETDTPMQCISKILSPYMDFTLVPWWEVVTQPLLSSSSSSNKEEFMTLDETLKRLCNESAELLLEVFLTHISDDKQIKSKNIFDSFDTIKSSSNACYNNTTLDTNTISHLSPFNQQIPKEQQEQIWTKCTVQSIQECSIHIEKDIKLISGIFFGKMIGSFEQNAIGIRARHPLCRDIFSKTLREETLNDILHCVENSSDYGDEEEEEEEEQEDNDGDAFVTTIDSIQNEEQRDDALDESPSTLNDLTEYLSSLDINEDDKADGDDFDAIFSPLDGTAMFSTVCKMNHSCQPNVLVRYRAGWGKYRPLIAQCVALKDIHEGEELCISYIDSDATLMERKEELENYGFECSCDKCKSEMTLMDRNKMNGLGMQQAKSNHVDDGNISLGNVDENPIFGNDDENDLFGSYEESDDDKSDKQDETPSNDYEEKFQNIFSKISTKPSSQEYLGRIPLVILAHVYSFVKIEGKVACKELQKIVSCSNAKTTIDETQMMMEALLSSLNAIDKRDFFRCQSSGRKGENIGLQTLKTNGSWSHSAWRIAYGCCALTAALGFAANGFFLYSLEMLDKSCILGLPREKINGFFEYVEFHANECRGNLGIDKIHESKEKEYIKDYSRKDLKDLIKKEGLSKEISYQIPEILYEINGSNNRVQSEYIEKKLPVVVRNFASKWSSVEKWRYLDFFTREYGHRIVPVEIGTMLSDEKMKEELLTIGSFVETYLKSSSLHDCYSIFNVDGKKKNTTKTAYLAQHPLFDQIPALVHYIDASPSLCGPDGVIYKNVWMGTGGTRTPLHFDSLDNLFVQIAGVKYVRIYDSQETDKLYVMNHTETSICLQGNMSEIDCEMEDFNKHPKAVNAKFQETLMFPGDCLYIPARAWHYVRSLSTSISVNYWW